MRGRWARGGLAASVVLLLGTTGVAPVGAEPDPVETTPLSVPGKAVSLAQAGELVVWSGEPGQATTVPAWLSGVAVTQVVMPIDAGLALTADGRVVGWGKDEWTLRAVPPVVTEAKVAQIAAFGPCAGAVTRDGRVLMWGATCALSFSPRAVPAGLSDVVQLALSYTAGIALKRDGSVVAWGRNVQGITDVPDGLRATAVVADGSTAYALTEEGTVVSWGGSPELPASMQQQGNVKAIAASASGVLALLADNTLVAPGNPGAEEEFAGVEPVLLANGGYGSEFGIVDRDRAIHHWNGLPGAPDQVPPGLNGRPMTQFVLGQWEAPTLTTGAVVIAKLLPAELPQVHGAVKVGSVLSGVDGTFSAEPESVQSQWLVDDAPVAGSGPAGAQLVVTAGMVGRTISYRSTAAKTGEATVSSSSVGVTVPPVVAPPVVVPPVSSSTRALKVKVAKKAAKVTVTATVTATRPLAGTAVVTITKGTKTIVSRTVGVPAAGAVRLTVARFARLVAKKTKATGKKAKTAYRGTYTVSVRYLGNKQVRASAGTAKFAVRR
ncbi:MAG TPA: hypothetical protein VMF51_13470 [Nocardioides sp.]|uniref:hypothetical protein n=1 Tax=Nocardioides sp. TaxID=35761 RepID=UPI002B5653D1|nr:hypothetical protein [Nocardioides sp.]HTW16139.1 hypothetical protein [Nocardioides sp.]